MRKARTSEFTRGPAEFSGLREAVTNNTPDDEAMERERAADLEAILTPLQEKLAAAEKGGNLEAIKRAEKKLQAAVEALFEAHTENDDESRELNDELSVLSLGRALKRRDGGEELHPDELEARLESWEAILRYVFQDGINNPGAAFRNFVAVTRRISPDFLGAISQTEVGYLLGETRAAASSREKRAVEKYLQKWGVKGWQVLGDTKTTETRNTLAKAQKNNTNRRGKKRSSNRKPKT